MREVITVAGQAGYAFSVKLLVKNVALGGWIIGEQRKTTRAVRQRRSQVLAERGRQGRPAIGGLDFISRARNCLPRTADRIVKRVWREVETGVGELILQQDAQDRRYGERETPGGRSESVTESQGYRRDAVGIGFRMKVSVRFKPVR